MDLQKKIYMIRKKHAQQLEPIKITKTEANYQSFMLDMMSKLVSEQRESNRLLRRLAGESDNQLSQVSLSKSSSRPILQALQKSIFLTMNSPKKQTEDQYEQTENASIIQSNHFSSYPSCMKEKEEVNELHFLNENSQKIIKIIDVLGETMKRIEVSLSSHNVEGVRSMKRDKTRESAMKDSSYQGKANKQNLQKPLKKIVQCQKEENIECKQVAQLCFRRIFCCQYGFPSNDKLNGLHQNWPLGVPKRIVLKFQQESDKIVSKLRVLYLSSNCINSLGGIQTLSQLEYTCFDKNNVDSLMPLAGLTNLMQISCSENNITSLSGMQGLSKVTILTLYKNEISQIKNLQNMKLKQLSLNNNPIERIGNLTHMNQCSEELCIGGTTITTFSPIYSFTSLKKLSLDGMKFKIIEQTLLKGLEGLVYLSLADNEIQKIQNMQYQGLELVQLNLKNNKLREVSGLQSCGKLQILKLQRNFISNIAGFKGIERLKVVCLQQYPLQDCTDLLKTDIEVVFNFTLQNDLCDPLYVPKSSFYRQYERYQKEKGDSSSGNNDDNEVQQQ